MSQARGKIRQTFHNRPVSFFRKNRLFGESVYLLYYPMDVGLHAAETAVEEQGRRKKTGLKERETKQPWRDERKKEGRD